MKPRDSLGLLIASGVVALVVGLTDRILTFLRPYMRPYLVVSGAVLLTVGIVGLLIDRRSAHRGSVGSAPDDAMPTATTDHDHHDHDHHDHAHDAGEHRASAVGWWLMLPILVAVVVAPGTLGAWAADHQRGAMFAGVHDFDLGPYLRAHAIAGTIPEIRMLDFVTAAADVDDRQLLGETDVRLTGFTNHTDDGTLVLDRFVVGCCVGDAALLEVALVGNIDSAFADETWLDVTVRFDPTASPNGDAIGVGEIPVATVLSVSEIDAPREPYEYLFG